MPTPFLAHGLVFIVSGLVDMIIGTAIALAALGLFGLDVTTFGLPVWLVLTVGALLAFAGAAVAFYNFSRLGE